MGWSTNGINWYLYTMKHWGGVVLRCQKGLNQRYRCGVGEILMMVLLLVAVPVHAQQSPHKSVLFEQLHNRSLQIGESDASHLSQRMHLLWMAHLVDDSEPAVALMVGRLYGIFLNQPQLSLEYIRGLLRTLGTTTMWGRIS